MHGRMRNLVFGYGSATLLQGVVGFASVPFLLAVLGPQAFAHWVMLEPLVAILAGFALAGVHFGHLHGITSRLVTPAAALRQILHYGWLPALVVTGAGGIAVAGFLGLGSVSAIALLCVVYVAIEAAILLLQFQARALSDALAFASTVWLRSCGIAAGLVLFKLFGLKLSLADYLLFMIVLDLAVLGVACIRHRNTIQASLAEHRPEQADYLLAVRYGLPIMLAAGFAMLVSNGDRYVVNALLPAEQLPAYVVMAKLAGAMSFAMAPINLWWPVARTRHVQDSDGGAQFFANVMPVLLAYYMFAAAALWVAAAILVEWYAPGVQGFDSLTLMLLIAGGVALGMSAPVNVGMLAPGKTHWLIVAVGLSALTGLGLAGVLIPQLGYIGAALATLCAQLVSLLSVFLISQRLHPIRWDYFKLATVLAIGGALLFVLWLAAGRLLAQCFAGVGFGMLVVWILRRNLRALHSGL